MTWIDYAVLGILALSVVLGLVRGFVLVSIAYLALSWALPPAEQPQWVRAAKTMPLLEQGSAMLIAVAPSEFGGPAPARPTAPTEQQRTHSAQDSPVSNPLPPGGGPGYKMDERKEMDRLIQGTQ